MVKSAWIKWKLGTGLLEKPEVMLFCIGDLPDDYSDEDIFFYCTDEENFNQLVGNRSQEDFYVLGEEELLSYGLSNYI